MGKLKIHCDNCGSDWEIYHRDIKNTKAKTCPMCGESIDGQTWEKQILPAFGMMEDCNMELFKDHCGYHGTLFTVAYEPAVIYPNKSDELDELREELEELKDMVDGVKKVIIRALDNIMAESLLILGEE